ncbi:MAG: glycosyltransferase, partial [Caldisphaeraceae archaeon]|nr:glycosyltransferase [Caldisphaeraceae archaeon]
MKYKVAVVHETFEVSGGGERLALTLLDLLKRNNFEVTLLTAELNEKKARKIFEADLSGIRVVKVGKQGSLERLCNTPSLRRLIYRKALESRYLSKQGFDIVIDTQANVPTKSDISYIHFPATLTARLDKSYKGFLRRSICNRLLKRYSNGKLHGMVLTNSKWTASKVYKEFGIVADVLYPPVDIRYFSNAAYGSHEEKSVVTISRFTPEKGLENILEVAKRLKEYNFYIIGSTSKASEAVIKSLLKKMKSEAIENVYLLKDLPRDEMVKVMASSKLYLHPPFAEHFGISVVEAMASGLIPIVYREGGAWSDIVSPIDKRLGYSSVEEAVKAINYALEVEERLREAAVVQSENFSRERFEERLMEKIKYIMEVKGL